MNQTIIDVTEAGFEQAVIQRSHELPVVVDFWAAWCGPCRSLGPMLEALAVEYAGRFVLARVDVDQNQRLAAQYGIQGIPAVKAFRDGRMAAEFVGAIPRPQVRAFIEKLLPNESDTAAAQASRLLAEGKLTEAEAAYRGVLAGNAGHLGALLGLAKTLMACRQDLEAAAVLERCQPGTPEYAQVEQMRMALKLRSAAGGAAEGELRDRVAADPADLEARFQLASWLAAHERLPEALDEYLEVVRRDRGAARKRAREAMLYLFDLLGEDPLARTYRNRLGAVLFV